MSKSPGYEKKENRFIIWSPTKGVYLGGGDWSKVNHMGKTVAPTFDGAVQVRVMFTKSECSDGRLVQVDNYEPNRTATREQIVDAGVEGWDPTLPVTGGEMSFEKDVYVDNTKPKEKDA